MNRLILVPQVLSDSKSPGEDKREEVADGIRVVCARSNRRMGCATCVALPSRFVRNTRHIGDHAGFARSGHIFDGQACPPEA